jgi:hypothetical protein
LDDLVANDEYADDLGDELIHLLESGGDDLKTEQGRMHSVCWLILVLELGSLLDCQLTPNLSGH